MQRMARASESGPSAADALSCASATASRDHASYRKKASDVLKDLKDANAEQDAWMRKMGLGHVINQKP